MTTTDMLRKLAVRDYTGPGLWLELNASNAPTILRALSLQAAVEETIQCEREDKYGDEPTLRAMVEAYTRYQSPCDKGYAQQEEGMRLAVEKLHARAAEILEDATSAKP